jgi:hypothetical protein
VRCRPATILGLAAVLAAPSALALGAPARPRDPAGAEVLFREGRARVDALDYAHACPMFAESLRLDHAPGTLLNLADCEDHVGRVATAWEHFRELVDELPVTDERQPVAQERAMALERRLPHLTIRPSFDLSPRAKITRDEVELGPASLDVALPVDPGMHTVEVSEPGHTLRRVSVQLREGQSRVVVAEPGLDQPDGTAASGDSKRVSGWIVGGVGVAALATGAYFGVSALSKRNDSDPYCPGGVCGSAASAQTYDEARSYARVADVALGIGVVALAVAGYLILTSGASDSAPRPTSARAQLGISRLGVTW